jgi:hypothetical protein
MTLFHNTGHSLGGRRAGSFVNRGRYHDTPFVAEIPIGGQWDLVSVRLNCLTHLLPTLKWLRLPRDL